MHLNTPFKLAALASRKPASAQVVIYWDKAVGGFYIAGSKIPEDIKGRLTALGEIAAGTPAMLEATK